MSELRSAQVIEPVRFETVLVTLDGGAEAERVIPIGTRVATSMGARIRFLAVCEGTEDSYAVRHYVEKVAERAGDGDTEVISAPKAAPAILSAVAPIPHGLLCMASHGRNRSAGIVGSVTNEVAAHAFAPLVVVGPLVDSAHPLTDRVVACVDGTDLSESVLPVAAAWAAALGRRLSIVTIAEPIPEPVAGRRYHRVHGPNADADAYVEALVDRWAGLGVEVDGKAIYEPVDVPGAILDHVAAQPTALIAATTHARTGPARMIVGSVAASLVHNSVTPVLLVPPHAPPYTSD